MTYESTPQSLNRSIAALESEARRLLEKANDLAIQRDALLEGQWGKGATESVVRCEGDGLGEPLKGWRRQQGRYGASALVPIIKHGAPARVTMAPELVAVQEGNEEGMPAGVYIKNLQVNDGLTHSEEARAQSEPTENHDPAISAGWAKLMKGLHRAP